MGAGVPKVGPEAGAPGPVAGEGGWGGLAQMGPEGPRGRMVRRGPEESPEGGRAPVAAVSGGGSGQAGWVGPPDSLDPERVPLDFPDVAGGQGQQKEQGGHEGP
jgi:hypothetical protein